MSLPTIGFLQLHHPNNKIVKYLEGLLSNEDEYGWISSKPFFGKDVDCKFSIVINAESARLNFEGNSNATEKVLIKLLKKFDSLQFPLVLDEYSQTGEKDPQITRWINGRIDEKSSGEAAVRDFSKVSYDKSVELLPELKPLADDADDFDGFD